MRRRGGVEGDGPGGDEGVGLRPLGNVVGGDGDDVQAGLGGGDVNVLDVVDPVRRGETVGVVSAAGPGDLQVEVVDQAAVGSGRGRVVVPDQRHLERFGGVQDGVGVGVGRAGVQAGRLVFVEQAARRGGEDGVGDVHPSPAGDVGGTRAGNLAAGAGAVLAGVDVGRAVDERRLHQSRRRGDALLVGVELAHQSGGPSDQRGRHAGAAHVLVVSVHLPPAGLAGDGGAGGDDERAGGDDIGLVAAVFHRPPAAESGHSVGVVGQVVAVDRVGGEVRRPGLPPGDGETGAVVLRRADGDAVFGGGGAAHRDQIHHPVAVGVHPLVAGGEEDDVVGVVPDVLIHGLRVGGVLAGDVAAPTVGVQFGPVAGGLGEEFVQV